jgi:hemoglobin/transferrin/lactoferrin receptor protein
MRPRRAPFRTFASILILWGEAWAQEPPKATEEEKKRQETVVRIEAVSPTQPKPVHDAPYSVDALDNGRIVEQNPRSFPHALGELPGVGLQKTGPGQVSPFIRGFTVSRNLMMIDYVRLNNSTFREGPNQYWSTIDSYLVDRLELIRGPSSVLYGSDSIGGTVLAFSKEPEFAPGTHLHSRTLARYASAEASAQARQEFSGNIDDFGWIVGGTVKDFGEIDGGRHYGEMDNTDFSEYDADLKFVFRVGAKSKVVLAAQHHRTNEAPRWHRTLDSREWQGTQPGTEVRDDFDQNRNLYYAQYHGQYENALVDAVRLGVSLHVQAEKEIRTPTTTEQLREFEVQTPGAFLQVGKRTEIGYLTFGADAYYDVVSSSGQNKNLNTGVVTKLNRGVVADEATYLQTGIFLQDEFSIGALDVTPGVRFSYVSADADEVDPSVAGSAAPDTFDDEWQAVTGSLRLLYHVDEHWNVIAGWGMGFRAPNFDDTTAVAVAGSGSIDVGGPDLDPERTHTFDLGVRADYARWGFSAFGFYTILDSFITRVPVDINGAAPIDFQRESDAEGWVYGFEVAAHVRVTDEITAFADWGYAKGEVEQRNTAGMDLGEQPLSKVPPSLVHVGARYEPVGSRGWFEALFTGAAEQDHLSVTDTADVQRIPPGGTPRYGIVTLRGGYRATDFLLLTAAVENLTNVDYRIHGSGQNEPGTNVILGMDLRF